MALFVEVARAGSFTGAAKASSVPIATLSRRIAALENRVGVRLLERTTRRLAVTEPGRRYLERCELIVQEAGLAHEALMDAAKRPAGRLRLSMPVEFGLSFIAPLIDEFARRHPEITFDLDLSSRPAPLADQKVDVSIRLGEITDPSLVVRHLRGAAVLRIAVLPGAAWRSRTAIGPGRARLHPAILHGATERLAADLGRQHGRCRGARPVFDQQRLNDLAAGRAGTWRCRAVARDRAAGARGGRGSTRARRLEPADGGPRRHDLAAHARAGQAVHRLSSRPSDDLKQGSRRVEQAWRIVRAGR